MVSGLDRIFRNQKPHYEIWYGKIDLKPGSAFWFRYSIMNGVAQQIASWGILFDQGKIYTGKNIFSLHALIQQSQVFQAGENLLTHQATQGSAGPLNWDLRWEDLGRRHFFEPSILRQLKITKSHYNSCLMDLRLFGKINHAGNTFTLENATGMIGHIYGKKQAQSWAWLHCNQFNDHPEVVCEGLSAQINFAGITSPPLTQFVLYVADRKYVFSSLYGALRADSVFGAGRWKFCVRAGRVTLSGEAIAPDQVALVEYTDTDDSRLWCHNSKLAQLTIRLQDPQNNLDETFVAKAVSAFELVDRQAPNRKPDL